MQPSERVRPVLERVFRRIYQAQHWFFRGRYLFLATLLGLEPKDWNALLDAHGALHDILVSETARGRGIGRKLLERVQSELRERGAARIVLHTATKNLAAQKLFAAVGFRKTMIEMTCEL